MENEYIDLEKITKSVEVLSSIDNMFHYGHLEELISELESLFRNINFEHDNCIKYKEQLESINYKLQTIKRKVFELNNSLRKSVLSFSGINNYSNQDVKDMISSKRFKFDNIMTTSLKDLSNEVNATIVDPLPIAISIGVTGTVGSLGAAIMDNYYKSKEENNIHRELELDSYEDYSFDDDSYKSIPRNNKVENNNISYRASRIENANRSFNEELVEDNYYDDLDE